MSDSISVDDMRINAALVSYGVNRHMKDRYVVAEFGATPEILVVLWKLLSRHLTRNSKPFHMLWWLYNCKHYPTKELLHKALRVSPPTSRKAMKPIKEAFVKIRHKVVRKFCSILRQYYCFFPFFLLITPHFSSHRFDSKTD